MIDEIKKLIGEGEHLYYNSNGNPEAYKLGVKHLSAAPMFREAMLLNGEIIPFKSIILVDFNKKEIIETDDNIKLIKLTELQ